MCVYIAFVKREINHVLNDDAEAIMKAYYHKQRQSEGAECGRVSTRMLESLIRIAEAHARLMFRDVVCSQDAIIAVMLMESSMTNSPLTQGAAKTMHQGFPDDPDAEYAEQEAEILRFLGLEGMITPFTPSDEYMHKCSDDDYNDTSKMDEMEEDGMNWDFMGEQEKRVIVTDNTSMDQ